MRQKALVVCLVTFLLTIVSQPTRAINTIERNVIFHDQDDTTNHWVRDNYAFVAHAILPDRLELAPFPRNVKWIVVVSIQQPLSLSEYWISMTRNYDGSIRATIKIPHEHSLAVQMEELKKKNPTITRDSIIKMLRVENYELNDTDILELRNIATSFEQLTFSPVMPDMLGSDLFEYHVWTESQYGQQMSAQLVGFGPTAKKQPHPLVEWAERLRVTVEPFLKRRDAEMLRH